MDNSPINLLQEISHWKMEAADEDIERYFYMFDGLSDIINGRYTIILGRKGSGKTAIIEHIASLSSFESSSTKITFMDFPFEEFSDLLQEDFPRKGNFALA